MHRTKRIIVIMWCWCLLLTLTCADNAFAGGSEVLHDFRQFGLPTPLERKVEFRPLASAGILFSDNIKSGNFTGFTWNYPMTESSCSEFGGLKGLKISYQAHVVGEDGSEYVSWALFAGIHGKNNPAPRYGGVVEGILGQKTGLKGVTLSTKLNRAYTLFGKEISEFEPDKWKEGEYRRSFVLKYGTPLSETNISEIVKKEIMGWYVYKTKIGLIVSPWPKELMEKVEILANINPRYTFIDTLADVGNFRADISPIQTASSAILDVVHTIGAKSQGFDDESYQSRMEQGYNILVWNRLWQDYFKMYWSEKSN